MSGPSGTVTFLFTDVEGSTRLWETVPDAMRVALVRHDEIMQAAIRGHGGLVFSTGGDGFAAAFARAADALAAALEAQVALDAEVWPAGARLGVRMGLHTGEVEERDGDYFGPAVNWAARLMAVAHGGQTVCSQVTAGLVDGAGLRSLGEHRLRDLGAAEQIFQVGGGVFAPLRSVDVVPTNLPTVRTELIGRSDDIASLSSLVEQQRLVTLTGVGGVGKTRLALAVAAAVAAGYPDGCWLIELASVANGGEVYKTVAATIGAPVSGVDALVSYLSDRRMLVVVDNCEHVLADTADLVDAVLAAAPELRLLVTSREPLGVDGEQVRRVQSLALPVPDATVEMAAGSSAVALFAARAEAVSERFAIGPGNLAAVVEICRHLDGIPLAIELAAARAAAMAPAEIAARLGERFRLLAGGSRRGQERHRTLQAAVSWSHDLLSDDDKVVFRRLAVFPATFDLAAAETVAGGGGGIDVLDTVLRLVGPSMVQYEPDQGRYRLLETLRQCGADRLVDAGETDDARGRHARHFLDLVERIAPQLADARYLSAINLLNTELDNLRAVAEWCIDGGRWPQLAELARRLWLFLQFSDPADAVAWYGYLIDHGDDLDPQELVDVLSDMATVAVDVLGDFPSGVALAERSLAQSIDGRLQDSPWAWSAKAFVALTTARTPDGLHCCERALAAAEARGDEYAAVVALGFLGMWLAEFGDADRSAHTTAESLRRAALTGNPNLIGMTTLSAAGLQLWGGPIPNFAAALAVLADFDEGPLIGQAAGLWFDIMWGATLVGLHRTGAVGRLARAVQLADRHGVAFAQELALRLLATAVAESGCPTEAATLAGYSDAHLRQHRMNAPTYAWIQESLEAALAGVTDRALHEAAGRSAQRSQIMALVTHLDTAIDDARPVAVDD